MSLTAERLRELLHYDPVTGLFVNLSTRKRAPKGAVAGSMQKNGYIGIGIDRRNYYAHRLAWLYMTGEWPNQVDHIDHDRANNSWANLRACTNAQNQANRKPTSRIGLKGVTLHSDGKWMAQIMVAKRHLYLGLYETPELAHEAYCVAAVKHFGDYAYAQRNLI